MKKALNIIGITVVWAAIIAYVVIAGDYGRRRRADIDVSGVRIVINDSSATKVINPAMVERWLKEGGFAPVGKSVDNVDTRTIRDHISQHPEVRRAGVWTDLNGVLTVQVSQRTPIMRIRSSNGYRFWVTDDNHILPDRGNFPAYVPVVTGHTPFPFSTSAKGSYDEILRANYEDYLGQFIEIEAERRSLTSQRTAKHAEIRSARASRPKRFWSGERKEKFHADKKKRIAGLQNDVVLLDASLASLAAKKEAISAKEKKSYQNHHFLTKLVNFVKSIENDDFWGAQIVQINVLGGGENGLGSWKEPQIELVPRAGDHIVLLGILDGYEREKLDKLKHFYLRGLWHEGWESYRYINIKYKDQIVCTK